VLNVSRSGFYEWLSRLDSPRRQENELLLKQIRQIHDESRGTYGSPRIHAELTLGLGLPVNLKRVARLMRQAGIQGLYRRRRRGCTVRDADAQPATDLVNRQFTVDAPNRLWITDITEHPTMEGKVYCAAVMDAYARLIVGWSIAEHMRTELVTDALGMAIIRRRPEKRAEDARTILHSDHGSQYQCHSVSAAYTPPRIREYPGVSHGRIDSKGSTRQYCFVYGQRLRAVETKAATVDRSGVYRCPHPGD
jgi:putative transposase